MSLLVLHHTPDVGLGALAAPLEARDGAVRHVAVAEVDTIDLDDATGVLVLGGRPDGGFPTHELDALRRAVDTEVAVFGIDGGGQALAEALGGEVAPRARPEAAFVAVHRTAPGREDPVSAGWPDGSYALALHRHEVVRLPGEAEQLLIGSDGPSLWRLGSAWATSLHVEADADTVARWFGEGEWQALAADAGVDPEALVTEAAERDRFTRAVGTSLVLRWLDGEAAG